MSIFPLQLRRSTPNWWKQLQNFVQRGNTGALPVTLDHNRIFILPSARGWYFILTLMIMLVASMNYSINLGFALCFLLTGLVSAALLSTFRNLSGLTLESVKASDAHCGEKVGFRLTFTGKGNQPRFSIRIRTRAGMENTFNLEAEPARQIDMLVEAEQRGWKQLGRLTLSTDYPLGLWRAWSYLNVECRALVYPRPEALVPQAPGSSGGDPKQSSAMLPGDDEFHELAPYQNGDPLSHIAWKQVARGMGWYSKRFSHSETHGRFEINYDDTRNLGNIELRLSRLTAWVNQAHRAGVSYALILPTYNSGFSRGDLHHQELLTRLALFGLPDGN